MSCGTALTDVAPALEQRKTVSVIFADVTGSTALGERLDPESLRRVMGKYFEVAQRVIQGHGGTVQKFAGDAVMAVFGVPVLHEDDALRAVRAAAQLRAAMPGLNAELEHDHGITLQIRTGVNTGEVVTRADEWLAMGDAVNVAARLEQLAPPGEILLGAETLELVRDAVVVDELVPAALKGKSKPVPVYRLVEVSAVATRPLDSPMIGRVNQLRMLEDALANVVRERTCSLFTLLGAAGVGKSRLGAEFVRGLDATVVRGHCLSYGEGITYFPVVEVVSQLLSGEAELDQLLAGVDKAEAAAIRDLLGDTAAASTSGSIAFAVRKLLERAATTRPLVVVLDDIHWGEQTFFELLEHVTDLSRDAPILLLCLARPELLERRPTWGGGKLNVTTVLLEPLNSAETDELIDELTPAGILDSDLRERVRDAAAGNPLFVEEILAVARAADSGSVHVPATIHALLAARLDQLEPDERRVLERGAVEGNSFHVGALVALAPEEADMPARLVALIRKDLIRPDRTALRGEEAFRFRHILIRDAAYDGLPKSARAELHERFAYWLEERATELVERDEIVGYHLEQAFQYRTELGPLDDTTRAIGGAAAKRLGVAGWRALDRDDNAAAVNLLERASLLQSSEHQDVQLELGLVRALMECGRFADAAVRAAQVSKQASATGDRIGELRAELARLHVLTHLDEGKMVELEATVAQAQPLFEKAGDDAALASLWQARAALEHYRCRFGDAAEAALRGIEHASRAGDRSLVRLCQFVAAIGIGLGPTSVDDALHWLERAQAETSIYVPEYDEWRAVLLALVGRIDEARPLLNEAVVRMTERGMALQSARVGQAKWRIEMAAGDLEAAERAARDGCVRLEKIGERAFLSTQYARLALVLYALARYGEAESWARRGLELGSSDDLATQLLARQVLAKVSAQRGERAIARALAAEVTAISELMQSPEHQGDAALDVAEVLRLGGELDEAAEHARKAEALYRQKGATVWVAKAARYLASVADVQA